MTQPIANINTKVSVLKLREAVYKIEQARANLLEAEDPWHAAELRTIIRSIESLTVELESV